MTLNKLTYNSMDIAEVISDTPVITDAGSALDLLMSASYELGTKTILIDKRLICEDFFILSRGLAGEVLQKFVNYGGRIAIYGDFTRYTSKPLHDFIYESNKGRDVCFVPDRDTALAWLAK
ncbi:MAG: DUF4180 domain-containing protein [Clostridia bacterium]|nr:DUF4180 domain-containing protein [Clostridia bacterium]